MGCLKLKGYAMIARTVILGVVTSYCGASVLLGAVEVEPFDENGFTNPFFDHEFEIDQPGVSWDILDIKPTESWSLWLAAETDLITWNLQPGDAVQEIRLSILDFEGGFIGTVPSSAVIVRAESGDFVALHATELGVAETVSANVDTIGQLFGKPLGVIVSIHLQVANEGNSAGFPFVGAFIDDLTVSTVGASPSPADLDGDGDVDAADLAILLGSWGPYEPCPPFAPADLDEDCTVGAGDLAQLLGNWGP